MELQTVHWRMPNGLEFEWSLAKAALNLRKHRVSFPYATRVFLDPHRQEQLDTREEYGEERWIALGRVDEVVLVVVYTLRGSKIRLISARKADRSDYGNYWH
ncbi:MAG: BrnT family toxin [Terracidiphilus sp.]|jgi:uncharacterized DUF497 family protein